MSVARTVLSVSAAVLTAAAAVLLVGAFFQAWRDARKPKVVISTLGDATGDEITKNAVTGLTHRLREEMLDALPSLARRMEHEIKEAKRDPTSPLAKLVLEDVAIAKQLISDIDSSKDLTASITSLAPESARGALRIISETMLRPRGARVSGVLQRANDGPGGLGLSFTVEQLQAKEPPSRVTLWEDGDTNTSGRSVVERLHALVVPASRSVACELLHQHLTARTRTRRLVRWLRPGRGANFAERKAVIELVIGTAYVSAAARYKPATMSFYQRAERALANTAELDHYRVSLVRAEALAQRARREKAGETAKTLFQESVNLLDKARAQLLSASLDAPLQATADLNIRASLATIGCLLVHRFPDEPWRADDAAKAIAELLEVDTSPFESSESMQDSTVLYNLASAFTVASHVQPLAQHGVDLERCLVRAKQCLLNACLRHQQRWTDGKADPDLAELLPWLLDAEARVLAMGGDGPREREAICAIVTQVVDATQPEVQTVGRSHRKGRRRTPTGGAVA